MTIVVLVLMKQKLQQGFVMSTDFRSGVKLGDLRRKLWSRYRSNLTFQVPRGQSVLGFGDINANYDLDNFLQNELPAKVKELDLRFDLEIIQSGSFTERVSLYRKHSQDETVEQEYDFLFLIKEKRKYLSSHVASSLEPLFLNISLIPLHCQVHPAIFSQIKYKM